MKYKYVNTENDAKENEDCLRSKRDLLVALLWVRAMAIVQQKHSLVHNFVLTVKNGARIGRAPLLLLCVRKAPEKGNKLIPFPIHHFTIFH